MAATKFMIKGGFASDNIIASENILDWYRKEHEKNLMEKDPVIRALHAIKVAVNTNILPPNPLSEKDIQEVEKFPFAQIDGLAPPSKNLKKLHEIKDGLSTESTSSSEISTSEKEMLTKILGISSSNANDFVRFIKGDTKTL